MPKGADTVVHVQVANDPFNWVSASRDGIVGHPSLRGRNSDIWKPEVSLCALPKCLPFLDLSAPLFSKKLDQTWAGHVDSVEHVPSLHEALGLTHSIT
jgi:hypothetical protein